MVQQFNLNVERQLPGDVLLTVGYAGARSTHLVNGGINMNIASPAACGSTPGYTFGCGVAGVPWPNWGTISNIFDSGFARYDSLQVKAETKSKRHGLYSLIAYTYGRAWDNGLVDSLATTVGATYYPLPGAQQADTGFRRFRSTTTSPAAWFMRLAVRKGKTVGQRLERSGERTRWKLASQRD